MNNDSLRILIADDERSFSEPLKMELLAHTPCEVRLQTNPALVAEDVESFQPHVVILDHRFREGDVGVEELLPMLKSFMKAPEVIVVTAQRGREFVLPNMARDYGAFDFRDKADVYRDEWIFTAVKQAYTQYRKKWGA